MVIVPPSYPAQSRPDRWAGMVRGGGFSGMNRSARIGRETRPSIECLMDSVAGAHEQHARDVVASLAGPGPLPQSPRRTGAVLATGDDSRRRAAGQPHGGLPRLPRRNRFYQHSHRYPQCQGPGIGGRPLGRGVLVLPDDPRTVPAGRPRAARPRRRGGRSGPGGPPRRLAELADATRQSFTWPTPGEPRDPEVPFVEEVPDPEVPPPTFGLIVLDPVEVDHLELDGNPQNRWTYRRDVDGRWAGREVNP